MALGRRSARHKPDSTLQLQPTHLHSNLLFPARPRGVPARRSMRRQPNGWEEKMSSNTHSRAEVGPAYFYEIADMLAGGVTDGECEAATVFTDWIDAGPRTR